MLQLAILAMTLFYVGLGESCCGAMPSMTFRACCPIIGGFALAESHGCDLHEADEDPAARKKCCCGGFRRSHGRLIAGASGMWWRWLFARVWRSTDSRCVSWARLSGRLPIFYATGIALALVLHAAQAAVVSQRSSIL